ncbi:3065_t:CDS:2 [Funneliformis geosporum]|nr:3065_t:CDS:2 [Funneliformis geosporum]
MEPSFKKPRKMDLNKLINNSRSKNTDYSTSTWVRALEKFRSDKQDGTEYHASSVNNCLHAINRHLNEKSTLPKPIIILNKNKYYKL